MYSAMPSQLCHILLSNVATIMADHLWRSNPEHNNLLNGVTLGASHAFD